MPDTPKKKSRKSFLLWATAFVGSFTAFKLFVKKADDEFVVMLSEDGKLVKINKSLLDKGSTKITTPQLQSWVKTNTSNK